MLLLLLSFYEHYGLLNCDEIVSATFNESLLVDHHRKILQEVNTLLKDLELKTRNLSVIMTDDNENDTRRDAFINENFTNVLRTQNLKEDQNLKNTIKSPVVAFRPSPNFDPAGGLSPFFPGFYASPLVMRPRHIRLVNKQDFTPWPHPPDHVGRLKHSVNSGLKRHPSMFSEHVPGPYVASYPYEPGAFRPLPIQPPYMSDILDIIPHEFRPYRPIVPSALSSSTALTTSIKTTTVGSNAKIWLKEIAPYTRGKRKKKKKGSKGQSRPYYKTTAASPRTADPRNDWIVSGTANTAQLFKEYEHGFLQVTVAKNDGRPGKIKKKGPHLQWTTSTAAGLHEEIEEQRPSTNQLPQQRYLDLMDQLGEGYLMVFVIEMFRLIAVKKKHDVQEILAPVKTIYNMLVESGYLAGVGDPLLIVIEKLIVLAVGDNIDVIRTYSSMMFHTLLQRKQVLSIEVNSIIDKADMFYSNEEGEHLLRSLRQFEDYPNTPKSSFWICHSLVENFLKPYRRQSLQVGRDSQSLLDSVNSALRQRFPLLLRGRSVGTIPGRVAPQFKSNLRARNQRVKHLKKKRKRKRRQYNKQIYYKH